MANIPLPILCFVSGTLIRVHREGRSVAVPVETLKAGELAVTTSGEHRPIRWIGHRTVNCEGMPSTRSHWPVRIAAHAFDLNKPSTDLFLSPGHSVCLDVLGEVLVPIQELVNGSTIAYVEMPSCTYWHVELDSHDLLVANDLAAESFLEMGDNRALFENASGDLPIEASTRSHADFCREFVDSGPLLTILRQRLAARALRLGWTEDRSVEIFATSDGRRVAPLIRNGEAVFALTLGTSEITLHSTLTRPELLGLPDQRLLGLAIYALDLIGGDGEIRRIDLDASDIAGCFHRGEQAEKLHYRYSAGDIVLPREAFVGLAQPFMLRLAFEASTLRRWIAPEPIPERVKLRAVA